MVPFGFLMMTILDNQGIGIELQFEETLVGQILPWGLF